jgi:intracellular septation protein
MKQLLEFLPIILFFIVYKLDGEILRLGAWSYEFDGIFSATLVLMMATLLQVLISFALSRQLEKRLIWLLLATLAFGGLTLAFRNELFLM